VNLTSYNSSSLCPVQQLLCSGQGHRPGSSILGEN